MGVTLSQASSAALSDRPGAGGLGLSVSLTAGTAGQYLEHDLGVERSPLHVRVMIDPATATGGVVVFAQGLNQASDETFRIGFDPSTRVVTVRLPTGDVLTATLPAALPWHSVELKLDVGEAALWLNGLRVDSATGSFGATQTLRLGGVFKSDAATGELHLDEWAIADDYIGPVVVGPAGPYANDPSRWLVVYNNADPDGATWADAYRAARGVPYANLCGLDLPTDETITAAQYADLVNATNDYLDTNGLRAHVMGVLLGYRVPGYVDTDGQGALEAVPALLHRDVTSFGLVSNVNAADTLPTRPTQVLLGLDRLTARLDGPDLAAAIGLIDRATTLIDTGLGDGGSATLWFDPFAGSGVQVDALITAMVDWSQSMDRMRTRLPFALSGPVDAAQAHAFDAIRDDGFFWGWATPTPPAGFFDDPAGDRAVSIQLAFAQATATTLRSATPGNWIDTALDAGYAAAVGAARGFTPSAAAYPRPFFDALRRGWTLAEAWYVALPLLREGLYLVGDPLLTVTLPRAGWDLFGPYDRLEAMGPATPSHGLRADAFTLTLPDTLRPADGERGVYVVRRLDEQRRSEMSLALAQAVNVSGQAAAPPTPPSWPDHDAWPVTIEDGEASLCVLWDRPLRLCAVAAVELRAEVDGGAETTIAAPDIDAQSKTIEVDVALPGESARYRWRLTSSGGAAHLTPWSATLRPRSDVNPPLTLLEVRP